MGCCSSLPQEEGEEPQTALTNQPKQVTKICSSLDTIHAEKIIKGSSLDSHTTPPPPFSSSSNISTCTIFIRLSNSGKDIPIQIPIEPPYFTVATLRKDLLSHLDTCSTRVKLIYLGRILPDQYLIVPIMTDPDSPLPATKKSIIQIQKEGVIQAMITNSP